MTRRNRELSRFGRNTPLPRISLLLFLLFTHFSITPTWSVIYIEEINGAVKYDKLSEPPPSSIGDGWSEEDLLGYRLGTPDHYLREGGESSIGSGGVGATTHIDESGSSNDTATVSSPSNVTSPSVNVVDFEGGNITEPAQHSTVNIDEDSANISSPSEAATSVGEAAVEDKSESESGAVSEIDATGSSNSNNNNNNSIGASFFDFFDKEDFFAGVNGDQDVESQENETISIFERSLENQDETGSQPPTASPSVSRLPTRVPSILPEITGAYTDHYPPHSAQHSHSQTYFELFNYFDDLKLLAGEGLRSEKLVFYDSKQAGFGSDLGPRGNAIFANIMLPPRWTFGYRKVGVEGDQVENTDAEAVRRILQTGETQGKHNSTHLFNTDDTIDKHEANACADVCLEILPSQYCPPGLELKVMPNCLDAQLGQLCEGDGECGTTNTLDNCFEHNDVYYKRACNETLAEELDHSDFGEIVDNVMKNETIDSVTATFLENGTLDSDNDIVGGPPAFVNEMEDSFEFDTSIADYFCLEDFIQWRRDQKDEPKASSVQQSPLTPYFMPNPNSIESSRSIAIMAKRGRCSFESKARMAMVFNDLFIQSGRDSHIDAIIVYNNGTRLDNNTSERLIEMNRIRQQRPQVEGDIRVGLLYIATPSGLDLLDRIRQRYIHTGLNPYLDVPMLAARRLRVDEATVDDGQRDHIVGESFDETYHDPRVTHGWFFPATLSKFCLECGPKQGYGFLTSSRVDKNEGDDVVPVIPPYSGHSPDDYFAQPWLEVIRKVMVAILIVLLLGPLVLAAKRWHTVGGTVRISTDERGRRHLLLVSPSLEVFVNGAPGSIELNGTKLDRAQVYGLPEIEYAGSNEENVGGGQDQGDELSGQSPTHISNAASPDSGRSGRYVSSSSCSICLEDFEVGEKVRLLPRCQHFYHTECVLPWLTERQGCCPMCKTPVLPESRQRSTQRRRQRRRLRRPDSDDPDLDLDISSAEEAQFVRSLFTRDLEDDSEHNQEDDIIGTAIIANFDSIDEEQGRVRVVTPPQSPNVNEEQTER